MEKWFTLSEAAEHSGLGNTTLRSKIQSGELAAVKRPSKHGQRWEISQDSLILFTAQREKSELPDLGGTQGLTLRGPSRPSTPISNETSSSESETTQNGYDQLSSENKLSALTRENLVLQIDLWTAQSRLEEERTLNQENKLKLKLAKKHQDEQSIRLDLALAMIREARSIANCDSQESKP